MIKLIYLAVITFISLNASAQNLNTSLEQRLSSAKPSYYRYVPLGIVAGTAGTLIGTALGNKSIGVATGAMSSLAASYLVRSRTDAITSLHTAGAGLICTAALTISLNKRKKKRSSVECFTF